MFINIWYNQVLSQMPGIQSNFKQSFDLDTITLNLWMGNNVAQANYNRFR